jgi:single-stranded-DNA-specific exonuclease
MQLHDQDVAKATWVYPKVDDELLETIMGNFHLPKSLAQILVSRGFKDQDGIHHYLYDKLPDIHDPNCLEEMGEGVKRVCHAIEEGEMILIYGDNDVDGMTSIALLVDFLERVGAKVCFFVSTPGSARNSLIVEALDYAKEKECKLIITVDCGITAAEEVQKVTDSGIDVIITDHHEPTHSIPKCFAILNPKLENSKYPNRDITGVGVAFKLAHGVTNELVSSNRVALADIDLKRYLDLVALGTVSDMGTLIGENRIFVRYGLKQLKQTHRVGLSQLISICGIGSSDINTNNLASKVAPRMNSLGRIADPVKGVHMLLTSDTEDAEKLAVELDLNNIERQKIERTVSNDVEQQLKTQPDTLKNKAIVLESDQWHPGVIAILSTRLAKHYYKPTIIIAIENGVGKGSIRSISEFPVLSVLKKLEHLLLNYGGHDVAAGLTIKQENIQEFKEAFIDIANKELCQVDTVSKIQLDAPLSFSELTFELMEAMSLLEPFGNGNPPPIFYTEAVQVWPPKIIGKSHLKLYLEQGDRLLEGIAFGMAHKKVELRKKNINLRIAFTPQLNTFHNKTSIQLVIKDYEVLDA